jgi:hypothetical protein
MHQTAGDLMLNLCSRLLHKCPGSTFAAFSTTQKPLLIGIGI